MPPGNYKVEVQKPGFKSAVQSIRLQINTPATLDLKLEIGQVSESINVVAETPSVNTQNASVGNPFTVIAFVVTQPGPVVYVIVAEPVELPVTMPELVPTAAMDVALLVHTPPDTAFVNVVVRLRHTVPDPFIAAAGFTVTVAIALGEHDVL